MTRPAIKIHTAGETPPMLAVPAHLQGVARDLWAELAPQLAAPDGTLPAATVATLEIACQAYADWREHTARVAKEGQLVKSPSGFPICHPAITLAAKSAETWRKFSKQLGLDRPSRAAKGAEPRPGLLRRRGSHA